MKVDYLIVGQGLAGSLLAWHLLEGGKRVLVVDRDEAVTSSKVAAGLVTPIAGQQFVMAANLEETLDFARQTYWNIEEALGQQFFHHLPIARLFIDETERDVWQKRLSNPLYATRYASYFNELSVCNDHFHSVHGGVELRKGGWLDVAAFVEGIRMYLLERVSYAIGRVDSRDISFTESGVKWKNITAGSVIFCEGWKAAENHFFTSIPMNNALGDILRCRCETIADEKRILNRGGWMLPLGGGEFRAGSTYFHDFTDQNPIPSGRLEVESRIKEIIKSGFEVLEHQAAIRPIIKRSQVFLGRHPLFPEIIYFNGLGSKGVLNAPTKTKELVDHLLTGKEIEKANDIRVNFTF